MRLSRLGQAFRNNMKNLYGFINAREKVMRGVFLFSGVFSILALATITVFLFISGVPFIASIHASSLAELAQKPKITLDIFFPVCYYI